MHVHVSHPDGEATFRVKPDLATSVVVGRSPRLRMLSVVIWRRSVMPGSAISVAEVTHVSRHGFWLLLGSEELHVPFAEFPWFRAATIEQITTVEWPSAHHLYWPLADVDLAVASIRQPADFPLMSRVTSAD